MADLDGKQEPQAEVDERAATADFVALPTALPGLTSLRWFAAFAVFLVHINYTGRHGLVDLLDAGSAGVSFFFVLSGFVLVWAARDRDAPRAFYGRRFARIYPTYLVTWLLALVITITGPTRTDLRAFVLGIPLLQSWWPHRAVFFGINGVAWSLSCEAFFYATLPVLLPLLRRATSRQLLALAAAALIVMNVVDVLAGLDGTAADLTDATSTGYWLAFIFPPVRWLEFLIGATAALLVRRAALPRCPVWLAATITAVSYLAMAWYRDPHVSEAVTVAPFVLLIIAVAQQDLTGGDSWLHQRWLITSANGRSRSTSSTPSSSEPSTSSAPTASSRHHWTGWPSSHPSNWWLRSSPPPCCTI